MMRTLATILGRPTARLARPLLATLGATVLAAGGVAWASNSGSVQRPKTRSVVVRVAHGPITAQNSHYIAVSPAGSSAGDLRTYYVPLTRPGQSRQIGYMTGTLTTTVTGRPRPGMELRTANLVFVIGRQANQIVVGGVAAYPETASTIATHSVVTRPVIGGSGRYAGARGWCVSTHLADNTWTHVFHLTLDR